MDVAEVTVMVMLATALGAFELIWRATVVGSLGGTCEPSRGVIFIPLEPMGPISSHGTLFEHH